MADVKTKIGVLGAGAWGTTLGLVAIRAGSAAQVWAFEAEVADAINEQHRNPFLHGIELDPALVATSDLAEVATADTLLLAVPAQHLRAVMGDLGPHLRTGVPLVICTKGIEQGTGALMSEVVAETAPGATLAVLSGPTLAGEVALGMPTAVTLACADTGVGQRIVTALGAPTFRPYLSGDVVGAQIGGAVKNVLAIACGIVNGRGIGEDARAAILTRGMAELVRLGRALGAEATTLMGLSGLGDLMLTCTSPQSRNQTLGEALGRGEDLADVMAARTSIAEGVFTAAAVATLAERAGIDMPISAAVDAIVNHGADIDEMIDGLLARPFRAEAS